MDTARTPTQAFKAVYFPDLRDRTTSSKSLTLAFSESERDLYETVRFLSSHEIRKVLGVQTIIELEQSAQAEGLPVSRYCVWRLKREFEKQPSGTNRFDPIHTTFQGGKELPLQNWYPYLEGYSPDFVRHIIEKYVGDKATVIYDPFGGVGTTPIAASELGYQSFYSEVNPLLQFLTRVKSKSRGLSNRKKIISHLERELPNIKPSVLAQTEDQELLKTYSEAFGNSKFFTASVLSSILKTRSYLNKLYFDNILVSELITVAVLASLIENSLLKRQGDLRFRRGKEINELRKTDYFISIESNLKRIINDLKVVEPSPFPTLLTEDARSIGNLPFLGIDAVITSPPYLNGTNYFRNTKVELWFLGYLKNQANLRNYRRLAVTAGINDVSLTESKYVINRRLRRVLSQLQDNAYDKRIPKMVHDYFADMHTIFGNIKKQLNPGAVLAIDLGDSIYGGVHVKTDEILVSVLENLGYISVERVVLRKRQSNNGQELRQVLLVFKNGEATREPVTVPSWKKDWEHFKRTMPHHSGDMSKRNWGDSLHSLCSYQGKLKPSIASQLVSIFVPEKGSVLDIFGGVGTIPLEAALQGKNSYSFDISPAALAISRAKLGMPSRRKVTQVISALEREIKLAKIPAGDLKTHSNFGLNKTLKEYFHPDTLREILIARNFFAKLESESVESALVFSALMHILHGNRPYALSRRSHGITPFAPSGEFEYKSLILKLKEKVDRTLIQVENRDLFEPGVVFNQDSTKTWSNEIRDLDAIITSPPFFDSTRFYSANWMRLWFAGWDEAHFKTEPVNFVDELQKKDFSVYDNIFMQARERLKPSGTFVLHLGKSYKCDMASELSERAKRWFNVYDIFEESVEDAESHGIKDRGAVTKHQYLILR